MLKKEKLFMRDSGGMPWVCRRKGGIRMAGRNVIPMKKRFRPNLGFLIFLFIIAYVIVLGWNYLTKEHISIYEVNTTEISDDPPLYGLVLRSEEVVHTDSGGYVNYYNAEGSRVAVGEVVYTIDQNGEVTDLLQELQSDTRDRESISAVREAVASFQNSFSGSDYQQVGNFAAAVDSVLFERGMGNLFYDLNEQMKSNGREKDYVKKTSSKNGIIVYSVDGYETLKQKDITAGLLDQYAGISRTQMVMGQKVESGDPVYKLVTSNDWSLVVKLDDFYYEKLADQDYVRVTIQKDGMSFNAKISLFEQDGAQFARLYTSRYMEHYINDRFLKLEFGLNSASGLKIPNSSILQKEFFVLPENVVTSNQARKGVVKQSTGEDGKVSSVFVPVTNSLYVDGKYYVDSPDLQGGDTLMNAENGETYIISARQSLPGVYCVNEGYCKFRPVEITYQNKEYTIVSDATNGGLAAYDHIVVDPSHLGDDDFIE